MPQEDKSADIDTAKRQAGANDKGREPKGVGHPKAEARAWATANKLHGAGKQMEARRKLPSGPIGGSGRKTNLARSS